MLFGKKNEVPKTVENDIPEDVKRVQEEIQKVHTDAERIFDAVIRPITFIDKDKAPESINDINKNSLSADPFAISTLYSKWTYDKLLHDVKESDDRDERYKISVMNRMLLISQASLFAKFIVTEFYNIVSTRMTNGNLASVSKSLTVYLLDKIVPRNTYEVEEKISMLLRNYKIYDEEDKSMEGLIVHEFSMMLYSDLVKDISLLVDCDARALEFMLEPKSMDKLRSTLDEESAEWLTKNTTLADIKSCYKALINADLYNVIFDLQSILMSSMDMFSEFNLAPHDKISEIAMKSLRHNVDEEDF